jgi:YegS/Rv2252/BmrU family lipid kinase
MLAQYGAMEMAMTITYEEQRVPANTLHPEVRRCLILANPLAGGLWKRDFIADLYSLRNPFRPRSAVSSRALPDTLPLLAHLAAEAGLEADVEPVPAPSEMQARVRAARAEGYDTIVAAGGDGTVRSVAQALVHSPLRLGILPVGTANNFAHALGIPFVLEEALRVLATGVERPVDAGRITTDTVNETFLEGAGVGLFADAVQAFGTEEPRAYQVMRLLRVMGPLLWQLRRRTLALKLDGVEQREEAIMVTVANGAYLGDGMPLAPHAALTDGLFDVVIVGALTRLEMLQFTAALRHGKHLSLPKVRLAQARTVEIRRIHRSHRPLPVHADDHIAATTPVHLDVLPGALRIIC